MALATQPRLLMLDEAMAGLTAIMAKPAIAAREQIILRLVESLFITPSPPFRVPAAGFSTFPPPKRLGRPPTKYPRLESGMQVDFASRNLKSTVLIIGSNVLVRRK